MAMWFIHRFKHINWKWINTVWTIQYGSYTMNPYWFQIQKIKLSFFSGSKRVWKNWKKGRKRNPKGWKNDLTFKIIVRQRVEGISLLEGEKWGLFADKNNVPIFSGDLFSSSWNHERDWLAFRQRGKIKEERQLCDLTILELGPEKTKMSEKCPTCNKTVYFAERIRSIGKDWHRMCLKCHQCGKILGKF